MHRYAVYHAHRRLTERDANEVPEHIQAAEEFCRKYGRALEDIERVLFGLDARRRYDLLNSYTKRFGWRARDHAITVIPRWRLGHVTMAGPTMTRLADLLPRQMTSDEKLDFARLLRTRMLERLRRSDVRIRVNDRRDLIHVAHQVMDVVVSVNRVAIPSDFYHIHEWLAGENGQALSAVARSTDNFIALHRLSDLLTHLGNLSRLSVLADQGFRIKVRSHFDIPTASVDIEFGERFWTKERKAMASEPPVENDQDLVVRLQEMALRQEQQDGGVTYIEYVMRTLKQEEQEQLRALAMREGLRTEALLQELKVKTIAARGDIEATISTAERLKKAGHDSKIESEHATASGTTRIQITNKARPCYIATACYGDAMHPDVVVLRRYRDETLSRTSVGRGIVGLYERLSPRLAARMDRDHWLSRFLRDWVLSRMAKRVG